MSPYYYSKKTKARINLYSRIKSYRIKIAPYSRYEKRGLTYLVTTNSSRYSRYIKARSFIKYNVYRPFFPFYYTSSF